MDQEQLSEEVCARFSLLPALRLREEEVLRRGRDRDLGRVHFAVLHAAGVAILAALHDYADVCVFEVQEGWLCRHLLVEIIFVLVW